MKGSRFIILIVILVTAVAPLCAQNEQPIPPEVRSLMQSAIAAHKQGKMDEAESIAKKALAISPEDRRIHIFPGYVYLEQNRGKDSSESFATAIKLDPTDKEVHLVKAQYGIVKAFIELVSFAGYKTSAAENKKVDLELAKLRNMDPQLADEMVQYRKTYTGGLIAVPPTKPE
jgi:tetratricopeptide (TPR) repeat protein